MFKWELYIYVGQLWNFLKSQNFCPLAANFTYTEACVEVECQKSVRNSKWGGGGGVNKRNSSLTVQVLTYTSTDDSSLTCDRQGMSTFNFDLLLRPHWVLNYRVSHFPVPGAISVEISNSNFSIKNQGWSVAALFLWWNHLSTSVLCVFKSHCCYLYSAVADSSNSIKFKNLCLRFVHQKTEQSLKWYDNHNPNPNPMIHIKRTTHYTPLNLL